MRWDRSHQSNDVDDLRAQSGGGRGGGLPVGTLLALGSRFGWKGILVVLVIVGAVTYGSGTSMCTGGQPATVSQAPQTGEADELSRFVGFVLDDVQQTWTDQLPGYKPTRLVLFRGSIGSACGTATSA